MHFERSKFIYFWILSIPVDRSIPLHSHKHHTRGHLYATLQNQRLLPLHEKKLLLEILCPSILQLIIFKYKFCTLLSILSIKKYDYDHFVNLGLTCFNLDHILLITIL